VAMVVHDGTTAEIGHGIFYLRSMIDKFMFRMIRSSASRTILR
jgi:hypothetical protein